MANTTSKVDLTKTFAQFLAVAISDGTFSDVLLTLKTDEPGEAAPATAIPVACGELWANILDDFIRAIWDQHLGAEILTQSTTDATPTLVKTLATLTTNGDYIRIKTEINSKTDIAAGGELHTQTLEVIAWRASGTTNVAIFTDVKARVGLITTDATITINGDDVELKVIGEVAKNLSWTIVVSENRVVA